MKMKFFAALLISLSPVFGQGQVSVEGGASIGSHPGHEKTTWHPSASVHFFSEGARVGIGATYLHANSKSGRGLFVSPSVKLYGGKKFELELLPMYGRIWGEKAHQWVLAPQIQMKYFVSERWFVAAAATYMAPLNNRLGGNPILELQIGVRLGKKPR